jgi:hypothetical protein
VADVLALLAKACLLHSLGRRREAIKLCLDVVEGSQVWWFLRYGVSRSLRPPLIVPCLSQVKLPCNGWKCMLCHRIWFWTSEISMASKVPRSFDYAALHVKARDPLTVADVGRPGWLTLRVTPDLEDQREDSRRVARREAGEPQVIPFLESIIQTVIVASSRLRSQSSQSASPTIGPSRPWPLPGA